MAERFVEVDTVRGFKVTCDSCGLDDEFRTKQAADYKADLHEIKYPCHITSVSVRDLKAREA